MTIIQYDGSWPGLLTAIFEVYEYKLADTKIVKGAEAVQQSLLAKHHQVYTDETKAERVKKGVVGKVGAKAWQELYLAYLSEMDDAADLILRVVQYYIDAVMKVSKNYAHEDILRLKQINKSVSRERHRFKAFVRFKRLQDGLYFAKIEPDFNVLPLIVKHFKDRYADQSWLIYDVKRGYGVLYDQSSVTEVQFDELPTDQEVGLFSDEHEPLYDDLWRRYFKSTNITERKNTKLHLQHVPKRYWKYLNEKW